MIINIQRLITFFKKHPKQLFFVDGLGALLTFLSLSVILPLLHNEIGLPIKILYYLSAIAFGFLLYSMSCYFINSNRWRILLRIIAIANLTYCFITIGLLFSYYNDLTIWGLLYFSGEILVILVLVIIELIVANTKTFL
ncbi:hypothetical protein [Aquimarina litoralis]|uniref:hypothetical protein n=1 Tax=Aquimarina litoralis TaxID=584605 RepID=UPI001C55D65E|nr:hypothetical protein [Aquimarina litoralis]MBW1296713.1 hypothetical protein [Aquimarina litoralis]